METQGNEDAALGCICGPQMDMEMKNAVAIQRNAAAIASVIKSLQALQNQIDDLIVRIKDLEDNSSDASSSPLP